MAEYGQNLFNLLEVEPSPDDQVDEKPAGKDSKKNTKKENKAPAKKAAPSEAPAAAAPAPKAPRKREYDRHVSGTGRGKETQKGGAGKHNWGDKDTSVEPTADAVAEPAADAPVEDAAVAEEDKQPTLGLDDYFKQLEAKRVDDDSKSVREVVDDENFKAIRALDKEATDEDYLFADVAVHKERKNKGSSHKKKVAVTLDEFVKEHGGLQRERDFDRARGGRGGRGGFRGGRGGRGGFGGPAPAGDDAAAAPAAAVAAPVAGDDAAPAAAPAVTPAPAAGTGPAPAGDRGGFRGGRGRGGRGRGGDGEFRGRGRGGRGGGDFRGGRGGGDFRGGRGGFRGHPGSSGPRHQPNLDIANEELFPALGAARK